LAGRRDRLVPLRAMRLAAGQTPSARFEVIEHAGHAPFLTHADAVAARLLDFLAA
jgi:pimeloyl-[acyl-carrier protein] methyl ester esterase